MKIEIKNNLVKCVFVFTIIYLNIGCKTSTKEETEEDVIENLTDIALSADQLKNIELSTVKPNMTAIGNRLEVNGTIDVPPQNLVSVSSQMAVT